MYAAGATQCQHSINGNLFRHRQDLTGSFRLRRQDDGSGIKK